MIPLINPEAASAQTVPGAQVFNPPSTIAADCSQDVTKALYDWINTLPEGTPEEPTEVQFASNGCYQIDGMMFLRGLTDFVFDGQGSTFMQSHIVNNELTNDPPPDRPAYCGFAHKYVNSSGTVPTGFDIMWFVEGGCDLVFENMNIEGTNSKGKPGGQEEQDSAIQIAGAQRVLISDDLIDSVWGDFVTISGLHEADFGGLYWPSFDVTVSDNSFNHSGRQGISVVYANRVTITGNTVRNVPATALDLEAEVGGGVEGNILVSDNIFHGYAYLVAAITYAQLFDFAFTDNTTSAMKIDLDSLTQFPGHDFSIGDNRASGTTNWGSSADVLLTNEATGLVSGNSAHIAPPTPDFVHASPGSGMISIQSNVLNPGLGAPHHFLPDPLSAASSAVATGCDNESSSGALLDLREIPASLAQCVDVQSAEPATANLPQYLASGSDASTNAMSRYAVKSKRAVNSARAPGHEMPVDRRLATASTSSDSSSPTGSQPGTVECTGVDGTVTFSPPLIEGGTNPEVVLAQVMLTDCTASGGITPDTGYATVSLSAPTNDCAGLEAAGESIATPLAIGWSPTTLGTSAATFPGFSLASNGDAGFTLGGTGTTVSGSYAGDDEGASSIVTGYSTMTSDEIGAACVSSEGLESLTIAGGNVSLG